MQMLKSEGATWTLFLDTDEYLVVDPDPIARWLTWPWEFEEMLPKARHALQPFLDYPPFAGHSCAYFARVMFNNVTETPDDLFTTRKYRQHTAVGSMPGKAVLDVSQLTNADMENTTNPHIGISPACTREYGDEDPTWYSSAYAWITPPSIVVHHYIGSLDSFLFREGDKRFEDRRLEHLRKAKMYGFGTEVGQAVVPLGSHSWFDAYNIVENDNNLILETWMDEFERDWESNGNDKHQNTFASLMNGE